MSARFLLFKTIIVVAMVIGFEQLVSADEKSHEKSKHVIAFEKYAVVAREEFAAKAGREILNQGGNAIDAAVATALALAVTHPPAGNIGGGGFIVYYRAKDKTATTFDFREIAPASSTARMYLDERGKYLPGYRKGPRASGVPGTVRGLALAHSRYGKLDWNQLVQPAERLARQGFALHPVMAASLNSELFGRSNPDPGTKIAENLSDNDRLSDFSESIRVYGKPDGTPWKGGDILIQPDLAETLRRLKDHGPDDFYTGKTAQLIADYSQKAGGLITLEDLAAYKAVEREPIRVNYRGNEIIGMGPPSSGGLIMAMSLNMLESFDLRKYGRSSAEAAHLVGEVLKRSFYQRFSKIGDPDFVAVPVTQMISRDFSRQLARDISLDKTTPSVELAEFPVLSHESMETTHFSVIDQDGNAVALTYTLEESYGAKCVVPGAGFLLNNEMGDFNLTPGRTTTGGVIGTPPNLIEPGKRMVSSMTPTIVVRDGEVRMVTGSPGGRTIPATVLWMILGYVEFDLDYEKIQTSPKLYQTWFPDKITLERSWPVGVSESLKQKGWNVSHVSAQGDAHSLVVDPEKKQIFALPDRRRGEGAAAGD